MYYAAGTDAATPSFVACPGSHHAWRTFCESEHNPCKAPRAKRVLNYLPLRHFTGDARFMEGAALEQPVRVHVPARALLLWQSRCACLLSDMFGRRRRLETH